MANFSDTSLQSDIQEAQYDFPYHYIPQHTASTFARHAYWSWGHRYIGGMHAIKTLLKKVSFSSLLDVGCGDGRLLRELRPLYPKCTLSGIDKSESAIRFAKAFNPELDYVAGDVQDQPSGTFDVATSVEVLEHIPPPYLDEFVAGIARSLKPNGHLVATVPHINQPVGSKHFQHFSVKTITDVLNPYFDVIETVPLDPSSKILFLADKLLGGTGNTFILSNEKLNSAFIRLYLRKYLFTDSESNCKRLGLIAKRKP